MDVAPPGAGEDGLEASFEGGPSEPLTATFGVSGLDEAGVVLPGSPAAAAAALRAPGGTYAFAPLTTAPYLTHERISTIQNIGGILNALDLLVSPVLSGANKVHDTLLGDMNIVGRRLREPMSPCPPSETCEALTDMISFANAAARFSFSLKSGALRSSLVV